MLPFEAVSVEFGLVFAGNGIFARALGFDNGKRFAVVAIQHIVGITFSGTIRHTVHFDFDAGFSANYLSLRFKYFPSGFT